MASHAAKTGLAVQPIQHVCRHIDRQPFNFQARFDEQRLDRDGGRHEGMRANAPHIGHDARMDISDRQPVDELARSEPGIAQKKMHRRAREQNFAPLRIIIENLELAKPSLVNVDDEDYKFFHEPMCSL